ncbi:hypothetical protein JZ751_009019, partial [Albula glossodonta]
MRDGAKHHRRSATRSATRSAPSREQRKCAQSANTLATPLALIRRAIHRLVRSARSLHCLLEYDNCPAQSSKEERDVEGSDAQHWKTNVAGFQSLPLIQQSASQGPSSCPEAEGRWRRVCPDQAESNLPLYRTPEAETALGGKAKPVAHHLSLSLSGGYGAGTLTHTTQDLPLLREVPVIMHIPPGPAEEVTMSNVTVRDNTDSISRSMASSAPYPVSFQVSLTGFLMLEIVLGLSSNLTVLVLYCMKSNLINSVSNVVTMNLHVLDVIVCVCCIPLTIVIILLSLEGNTVLVCCFHEACVSFASVATAANVLAITLDRYDISVKPANRVLTMGRAVVLLGAIWVLSFFSFLVPFMEVGFFSQDRSDQNQTVVAHTNQYYTELGLYYHLLAQIPIFFFTAVVMLITYSKILQALNIRIGTRFHASQKKKARKKKTISMTTQQEATDASQSSGGGRNPMLGMRTSVSVIIALRRAVKRHRERRERQKRVFRMSLLIISTFLLCWTPITVLNTVILSAGPSDLMVRLRLAFLVMAYGTTIFHPLLYAFTRQKFQKVLKSKMKKRVVSIVEADPLPNNTVIHNSWIDPKRNKKVTFEESELRQKCLSSEDRPLDGLVSPSTRTSLGLLIRRVSVLFE